MFNQYEQADRKSRALRSLEDVLVTFGAGESTQHFSKNPIRMSVWMAFAGDPHERRQLLFDLNYRERAEMAMRRLKNAYEAHDPYKDEAVGQPALMSFGSIVMSEANMDDMIQVILPQTQWFKDLDPKQVKAWRRSVSAALKQETLEKLRTHFETAPLPALWRFLVAWLAIRKAAEDQALKSAPPDGTDRSSLPGRWDSLLTTCLYLLNVISTTLAPEDAEEIRAYVIRFLRGALDTYGEALDALVVRQEQLHKTPDRAPIWSIDLNRPAELASMRSRQTLKVDAAENVFSIRTDSVRWAVIDSGIDARHPAFARADAPRGKAWQDRTRVVATYDFTRLQKFFKQDYEGLLTTEQLDIAEGLIAEDWPYGPLDRGEAALVMLYIINGNDNDHLASPSLTARFEEDPGLRDRAETYLQAIKKYRNDSALLNWYLLEPLLQMSHAGDQYSPPADPHGTHVAGILAGRMDKDCRGKGKGPKQAHHGMCPDLELYDLRVCDDRGHSDEFRVMAALQFAAYLNRTRETVLIDGANVSLQIKYDVTNYGCGQTPVCKEANRLVDAGVCVVAAAGNQGFHSVVTAKKLVDSYASCSIMDPGNAEKVITVGSTHRISPHTFGISYFSSRGPTADGRPKPDLVAPGEKILGPVPGDKVDEISGTSMAAPHVSGAAAMLMARYPEMKGQPAWIKRVLCETASDLGRNPEFQGAGLVDVLRALESI